MKDVSQLTGKKLTNASSLEVRKQVHSAVYSVRHKVDVLFRSIVTCTCCTPTHHSKLKIKCGASNHVEKNVLR